MNIKGNYELRVAVIDLDKVITYTNFDNYEISGNMSDEDFYEIAEQLGTIYSIGAFEYNLNCEELDNFTNSYIRVFLVNLDDTEELISLNDCSKLIMYDGEMKC